MIVSPISGYPYWRPRSLLYNYLLLPTETLLNHILDTSKYYPTLLFLLYSVSPLAPPLGA